MALSLKTSLQLSLKHTQTNAMDLSTPKDEFTLNLPFELINGTSAGQADAVFADERTVTTGATDNIDLAAVLTGAFGNTVTFAKVKAIMIRNTSATIGLTVGAGTNPWLTWLGATGTAIVGPGGVLFFYEPAGFAVTAATGDILKILNNGGGSVVYQIWILGTSA